jgi:CrcB protein
MNLVLFAGLGAIVGSVLRFLMLENAEKFLGRNSVWMVMIINLSSAFVMGIFLGKGLEGGVSAFWATGILGGYSTFSAPVVEFVDALESHVDRGRGLAKLVFAFVGGIPVLILGAIIGQAL